MGKLAEKMMAATAKPAAPRALLALEDGTVFAGYGCGAAGEAYGELCFNTSLEGYPEVVTDPSYAGQIVAMTYPQIGNYGMCLQDVQASRPQLRGLVVHDMCRTPSSWRSDTSFPAFLEQSGVVAIEGIDTRALVRHVRDAGVMRAVLSTDDLDAGSLVAKARASTPLAGVNLVAGVSCRKPYPFGPADLAAGRSFALKEPAPPRFHVVVLDLGVKRSILESLVRSGCELTVVPWNTTAEEIAALKPDGVFLSNGPGDPDAVDGVPGQVEQLLRAHVPVFGICMGHQMLCRAAGARMEKLKFGHHGANQPVANLLTGRVEITAQNHGFNLAFDSLGPLVPELSGDVGQHPLDLRFWNELGIAPVVLNKRFGRIRLTHVNLNDGSAEGVEFLDARAFSVQYHPEACPGPTDSGYLFDAFASLMEGKPDYLDIGVAQNRLATWIFHQTNQKGQPPMIHSVAQDDGVHEACAVFGVYAPGEDVARITCFGLQALQHRGQESAGIAVGDGDTVLIHKGLGLVDQVFTEEALAHLEGNVAIGHTRYSTAGGGGWTAAQPHMSAIDDQLIALAHNGTLVDTLPQRAWLANEGVQLYGYTDSEVAARTIGVDTRRAGHIRSGIRLMMQQLHGAYAIVLVTPTALYAFRDPNGIRPLSLGRLPDGRGWVVASETCGLDAVGAVFVRDVAPGEIVKISAAGLESEQGAPPARRACCLFEHVYFARPDSVLDGEVVYHARRRMGRILAREAPVDADFVLGVPDSGVPPALGFAAESGIEYCDGIVKNRYVGRTFIQPTQEMRRLGIRLKLSPLPSVIRGKRLAVIDDSIVRGNTAKQLVHMLRDAGASEVHLRIVSPEILWPCFYGIDTGNRGQLISANMTREEVRAHIGCDSLAFISLNGLRSAICTDHDGFCDACFSGDYPVAIPDYVKRKAEMNQKG